MNAEDCQIITIHLKYGGQTSQIRISNSATLLQLQQAIEERTDIMQRRQKLIVSGRVLSQNPPNSLVKDLRIGDNTKVMLLATSCSILQSQGQQALSKLNQVKRQGKTQEKRDNTGPKMEYSDRVTVWRKTGIASLRDLFLQDIPEELYSLGEICRVLDAGGNRFEKLSPDLSSHLTKLQKLRLTGNALGVHDPWPILTQFTSLQELILDNQTVPLTFIADTISSLSRLVLFSLDGNAISKIPHSIGKLTLLIKLSLSRNKLECINGAISKCTALEEIGMVQNSIRAIPAELGGLQKLRTLLLDNNKVSAVPSQLLQGCKSLSTLSLHGNTITTQDLRDTVGFAEYDRRRRLKEDKKVDMKVLMTDFDEGVDAQEFQHW